MYCALSQKPNSIVQRPLNDDRAGRRCIQSLSLSLSLGLPVLWMALQARGHQQAGQFHMMRVITICRGHFAVATALQSRSKPNHKLKKKTSRMNCKTMFIQTMWVRKCLQARGIYLSAGATFDNVSWLSSEGEGISHLRKSAKTPQSEQPTAPKSFPKKSLPSRMPSALQWSKRNCRSDGISYLA